MLPPALVLQNQCLLPTVLSQCPSPVLPLPHTAFQLAFHRLPGASLSPAGCMSSAPLTLLGRDKGPQPLQVLHGAPAVTGTEASNDPTPRKVQPCTFLLPQGLSPHPSLLNPGSYQLLLLAWDPQVQPHTRLGQLQHCVTCSITPYCTRSTIADAFSHSELFPETSCSEGCCCLCGGCAAQPRSGFVRARGVCVCFIPWCVPVNSVSYCGLLLYVFQWPCLFLAFLSLQIKCS